jgi:hypothetical protein
MVTIHTCNFCGKNCHFRIGLHAKRCSDQT